MDFVSAELNSVLQTMCTALGTLKTHWCEGWREDSIDIPNIHNLSVYDHSWGEEYIINSQYSIITLTHNKIAIYYNHNSSINISISVPDMLEPDYYFNFSIESPFALEEQTYKDLYTIYSTIFDSEGNINEFKG